MKPILMAFATALTLAGCTGAQEAGSDGYRPMATGPLLSPQETLEAIYSAEGLGSGAGYSAAGNRGEGYGGPDGPGSVYSSADGSGQGPDYIDYRAMNRANRNPTASCPVCELRQFSSGQQLNREHNTNVWPTDWFNHEGRDTN